MNSLTLEMTEHDRFYWQYEYDVVARYLIPLLKQWNFQLEHKTVLDVGCGDCGGISALHDVGMICKGFDVEQRRVVLAKLLSGKRSFELTIGNLYDTPPPFSDETFDLLVLHDVFEHLEQKKEALEILKTYLTPHSRVLITFPPYYSAFGAHQQLLHSRLGKMPFVHLLPFMMTNVIPTLPNEHKPFVEEIQKLGRIKMGIAQFEQLVRASGFTIEYKKFYLISPNHIRFGLKALGAGVFGTMPLLQEILVSGTVFFLKSP